METKQAEIIEPEKKTMPHLSKDTKMLADRLGKCSQGDFIEYSELSGIIDKNIQKDGRRFLYSAFNEVFREKELVFEAVFNRGIKCLLDEEIACNTGTHATARIRNISRKGLKKLSAVQNFINLTDEAKASHNTSVSMLGILNHASQQKNIAKIESKVKVAQSSIDLSATLEALM